MAKLAEWLWEIGAVSTNVEEPFELKSGNRSPIYIDCRKIIGYPELYKEITRAFKDMSGRLKFDTIAGGVTAGVPFAAWLAWVLEKPLIYIRPKGKEHGKKGKVEGPIEKGDRVLLIEDLITDGGSKLEFINSIRDKGAGITDCLVVFDREQGGEKVLQELKVKLHPLLTLNETLEYGIETGRISEPDANEVKEYLKSPKAWHNKRGFDFKTQ